MSKPLGLRRLTLLLNTRMWVTGVLSHGSNFAQCLVPPTSTSQAHLIPLDIQAVEQGLRKWKHWRDKNELGEVRGKKKFLKTYKTL